MEKQARTGYYDDFQSPLVTPIAQLVADLMTAASVTKIETTRVLAKKLAERVKNGDFDATKEESEAWAKSPDGQTAFNDLVSGR